MNTPGEKAPLSWRGAAAYVASAILAFQVAYTVPVLSFGIVAYAYCLLQLGRLPSGRQAYYAGLIVGFLSVGPQLFFFWTIFGPGATALWYVLAFWIALFVGLARWCRLNLPASWGWVAIPCLWLALEYFRSELYYLRFSWLNIGYVFSENFPSFPLKYVGVYGMGFLTVGLALACCWLRPCRAVVLTLVVTRLAMGLNGGEQKGPQPVAPNKSVAVAGLQLEFPTEDDVLVALNELLQKAPEAELIMLSEYTFQGPVPAKIKRWCAARQRYLVAGGKNPAPGDNFYNTAFVIGPTGDVIFRQVKSVPIQFFKDGLPAPEQKLWESPWGKIGICICYDLSYTRVTDRLIEMGAEALLVPTMDVAEWGKHQHELHARVARVRAAEYGVPIFRVASSGISQLVDARGRDVATAGFPGDHELLAGRLELRSAGSLPLDRWIALPVTMFAGAALLYLVIQRQWAKRRSKVVEATRL